MRASTFTMLRRARKGSIIVGVDNADFDPFGGVIYNGFVRGEMVSGGL